GRLDDRPPFLDLGLVELAEILRRLLLAYPDLVALLGELLADGRVVQRTDNCAVEFRDDVLRRALRRPHRLPGRDVQARRARLVHGRDFGRGGGAALRHHGKDLDAATAELRERGERIEERHVERAGHQVRDRRRGAAIGNKLKTRTSDVLEQDAADVRGAAWTRGAGRRLLRIGLQPGDQSAQIVRRQILLRGDQPRRVDDPRDRLEIREHIVGKLIDRPVDDVRDEGPVDDGVAVGRRASDPAGPDAARCAGYVLYHNRLSERRPHALGDEARVGVHRPAGRDRHYHGYRTRGKGLRPRQPRDGRQRGRACGQTQKISAGKFHFEPPSVYIIQSPYRRGRARLQEYRARALWRS